MYCLNMRICDVIDNHSIYKQQAVAVNQDNAMKALQLHATAHIDDRFIGWYRTGLQIDINTTSIQEAVMKKLINSSQQYSNNAGPRLDESEYIHLLVDTQLNNDRLSVKSYTSIPINDPLQEQEYEAYLQELKLRKDKEKEDETKSKGKKKSDVNGQEEPLEVVEEPFPIFYRFNEITCTYSAMESEKIGLDMIIESPADDENVLDSPSMIMNDTNHLERKFGKLLENLNKVKFYVDQVLNQSIEGDESIGWLIGDALSSVPNLSPQKFEHLISNRLQDFLIMEYLAKMTKAQLVVADKINQILPYTVPGYEPEKK